MLIIKQHPHHIPGVVREVRLGLGHQVLGLEVHDAVLVAVEVVVALDLVSLDQEVGVVFGLEQALVVQELLDVWAESDHELLVEVVERAVLLWLEFLEEVVVQVAHDFEFVNAEVNHVENPLCIDVGGLRR